MTSVSPPSAPCLLVRAVFHKYENGPEAVHALTDVSLSYTQPTFVCILGPSGCGKTTLLRIVAGLLHPTQGSVALLGRPPVELHPEGVISYLSQEPSLLPWRTVGENISLPVSYRAQVPRKSFDAKTLLRTLRLETFERNYPAQLSGGMKTRVALARAWITKPKILLLDEPFGALDPDTALTIGLELRRTRAELDTMVVMITHSAEQAALLADEVVVMSPRPARVLTTLRNPLCQIRDTDTLLTAEYFACLKNIRQLQRHSS